MGLSPGNGLPPTDPPVGLFDGIIAAIVSALNFLLRLLVAIANFIWSTLVAIVKALIQIFQAGFRFLRHIWENYIKRGITWLASHIQRIRDWLKRVLSPVLKFFQKLKHWYDTHILAQQLKLLRIIQTIRRYLSILRIFHIGFATQLDRALGEIQNRIEQNIAIVRGILNDIINSLALVLDPTLLIRRNVLGGTLLSNLGALKRIFGYSNHGPLTAAETTFLDNNVGRYRESAGNNHIAAIAAGGLTAYDQSERADSRKAISDVTGAPLPF